MGFESSQLGIGSVGASDPARKSSIPLPRSYSYPQGQEEGDEHEMRKRKD